MAYQNMQSLRDEQLVLELLARLDLPEFATPLPDRESVLHETIAAASESHIQSIGHTWRIAFAAALTLLVVVLTAGAVYLYGLPPFRPAWAAVDGYMLEYERVFRLESPISDGQDSDLKMMSQIAETLSEKYGDLDESSKGRPVLTFHSSQTKDLGYWRRRIYRFVALSDDAGLLAELNARMHEFKAISGPKKIYQRFYYRDSYSNQPTGSQLYFQEGRKIIVDGKEFRVPQDVNPGLLHRFWADFESLEQGKVSIRAYWIPGELYYSPRLPNPMGVGQLARVELNADGDMVVTTLQKELDIDLPDELFTGLGQHVSLEEEMGLDNQVITRYDSDNEARKADERPTIIVDLDSSEYEPDSDPVCLIEKQAALLAEQRRIAENHPPKYEYYFQAFPEQEWQKLFDKGFSEKLVEWNKALVAMARLTSRTFGSRRSDSLTWNSSSPVAVDTLETRDGVVLIICCSILTASQELAEQYKEAMQGTLHLGEPDVRVQPARKLSDGMRTNGAVNEKEATGTGQIWPTRSRLSPYYGPRECNLLWTYNCGKKMKSRYAIGTDGTLFVGTRGKGLLALNPNGSLKWDLPTGGDIVSWPAISADGTVYLSSSDYKVRAISPDGKIRWQFINDGKFSSSIVMSDDGTIYFGNESGIFYALSRDGSVKWKYNTGELIFHPAIGYDGSLIFSCNDQYLYALNPDGSLKWKYQTSGGCLGAPAVGIDGSIYAGSHNGFLYAFDSDGKLRWFFKVGDHISTAPAICPDGSIVFGSYDNSIYCLYSDGTLKWCYATGKEVYSSPAVGADGTVYIGCHDRNIYAIDPDGVLLWSYLTKNIICTSPAIGSDGTVYIGDWSGNIYAFGRDPSSNVDWSKSRKIIDSRGNSWSVVQGEPQSNYTRKSR